MCCLMYRALNVIAFLWHRYDFLFSFGYNDSKSPTGVIPQPRFVFEIVKRYPGQCIKCCLARYDEFSRKPGELVGSGF